MQPDFGRERFTIDVDYNESVENLLVKVSLQITDIPPAEMSLFLHGERVKETDHLDSLGVKENDVVELRKKTRSEYCCRLL